MEFYTIKKNLIPYPAKDPLISILGVPFDSTSIEYPGSRFGPKEIRDIISRFYGLDIESGLNFYELISDLGDLEVHHGSFEETNNNMAGFLGAFKNELKTIPCFLGGEHSITYSTVKKLSEYDDFDLIVFDAHADCFDSWNNNITHISYLNQLAKEKIVGKISLVGVRAFTKEELSFIGNNNISYYTPESIDVKKIINETKKKIYISIDMDVLEYYLAIGTGTPEYGGLELGELITYITEIIREKEVIGFDLVETNPILDGARITLYSAAILLKQIILELGKNN